MPEDIFPPAVSAKSERAFVEDPGQGKLAPQVGEAQLLSFADQSSSLIWIGDPVAGTIIYRSAAFERIWGIARHEAATDLVDWMRDVHPDDRSQVEHALAAVAAGEVTQFEYRIVRPSDGAIRWLRDTSFPMLDDAGVVLRIGGIVEDVTPKEMDQLYVINGKPAEARTLGKMVRTLGYRARAFDSASAFLDMAPVLTPGVVLLDLRKSRDEGLCVPRELRARSIAMPIIVLDAADADVACAVAAMKAGAADYIVIGDEESFRVALARAIADCQGAARGTTRDETASARIARLTPREREVLLGLVDGGTNKIIAQKLGISPRTVELHRAHVMNRLNASSLTELLQIALAAGITPSTSEVV